MEPVSKDFWHALATSGRPQQASRRREGEDENEGIEPLLREAEHEAPAEEQAPDEEWQDSQVERQARP